jgi:hypothetical protein
MIPMNESFDTFRIYNLDAPEVYAAWQWCGNISHWMFDVLPALLFLRHNYPDQLKKPVAIQKDAMPYRHVQYWIDVLGITPTPTTSMEEDNRVTVWWPFRYGGWAQPEAVHWIQEFSKPDPESEPFILIQRNAQGSEPNASRNLENRDDIMTCFRNHGIPLSMHFLENYSIDRQIRLFSNAKLVIGVHGAGMSNVVFCKPGTRIIEIKSPMFYQRIVESIAQSLPLNLTVLPGQERHGSKDLYRHCLYIEPELLWEASCTT